MANDVERLIGAFGEFREWERVEHADLKIQLSEIRSDIKDLNGFRWKVYGISSVLALAVSAVGSTLIRYIFSI